MQPLLPGRLMANLFFVGLNPRWQMYKFLPVGLNVMFSAAGFWNMRKKEWRWGRFPGAGYRWLDMGGFSLLNKYGDYPFTVGNAMNLVARLAPDWYASMDYPCEPEISRRLGLQTNMERIRSTVDMAAGMADLEATVPASVLVPVIQGYTLDEYKQCIDLYDRKELIRDYMAVGSTCMRSNSAELCDLIPPLYEHARQAGVQKLHFFGLKLSPDLSTVQDCIWSRDSAASLDAYDPDLREARDGRRWPRGQDEKEAAFMSFLGRVEDLGLCSECIVADRLPKDLQGFVWRNGGWDGITDGDGLIDRRTLYCIRRGMVFQGA